MGFSTSGATVVIFLGVLVSAGIFLPSAEGAIEHVADAVEDRNERTLDRRNADVAISNATYNTSDSTVVVNVTNEGAVTLSADRTDLLLNGSLQTGYNTSVDGVQGRTLWAPGELLAFEVDDPGGKPARVAVVTEHGLERTTTNVTEVA